VGSTFAGRFPIADGSQVWNFRVAGIIAPKVSHDTFWAVADPFSKSSIALNSRYYFVNDGSPSYNVLTASQAIEPKIAVLQATFSGDSFTDAFVFFLRYPFDLSHLDANDIPALSQQTTDLDNQFSITVQRNTTDLAYMNIFGTAFTTLEFSSQYTAVGQIAVTFLLLTTLALVLFLVSLMSDVLVERQAAIIATLRSRERHGDTSSAPSPSRGSSWEWLPCSWGHGWPSCSYGPSLQPCSHPTTSQRST
jgi:hypothetical protein